MHTRRASRGSWAAPGLALLLGCPGPTSAPASGPSKAPAAAPLPPASPTTPPPVPTASATPQQAPVDGDATPPQIPGADATPPRAPVDRDATPPRIPGATPAPVEDPPALSPGVLGPLAVSPVPGGAMVVWWRSTLTADDSELLAVLLDPSGQQIGPPRLLLRGPGEPLGLSASHRGGQVWLAWVAKIEGEDEPKGLLEAVAVAPDLTTMGAPIKLNTFASETILGAPEALVRVLALADGGAVVGAAGADARCIDIVEHKPTACPGFDMFWVRPDGSSTVAAHFGADGGDASPGSLIDIGTGVVFDVWAWHGGATHASVYARYGKPASKPPLALQTCQPPFTRHWTGAELVTLCPADYPEEAEQCPLGGDNGCARVHAIRRNGSPLTPKRRRDQALPTMTARASRCEQGHPVLAVEWTGGAVVLDPQRPGASIDPRLELGVWTGSHALKLAPDGSLERWICGADGSFEQAPASPARLTVDPPADIVRPVPRRAP